MTAEHPEARLTDLLLSLFSSDELRRLLRFNFPESLSNGLPGPSQAPIMVATAAVDALVKQGLLADLWPRLLAERPRRQSEIEAVRALFATKPTSTTPTSPASKQPLDKPERPAQTRLLYVLSCPPGQVQLDLQEEVRQVRRELQLATHRDRFVCEIVPAATYADLRKAMRQHKPHIVHIACHGTKEGKLVFSDGQGASDPIDPESLAELLGLLKGDHLALVVLNACHSSRMAAVVAQQIDLVISMNTEIGDQSALIFARTLYESLAEGDNVGFAFGLAVNELKRRKADLIPELLPTTGPNRQRTFV